MHIDIERMTDDLRREDAGAWGALRSFLDHMGRWVEMADRMGDLPATFWCGQDANLLNRMTVPIEYGGLALASTALRRAVLFEMVGRVCPAIAMSLPGPGLAMPPVASLGTEAQKRDFFSHFVGQDVPVWGAFAITEPQAGSDAAGLRMRAVADGDCYVLNGEKCFITSGARADVVVVFATLDPAKGRFGIRAFLVERGTPGFSVARTETMMGLRASQLTGLSFVDCRVRREAMLGHTGRRGPLIDALSGAQAAWDYMRPALAAGINGACFGMIDRAEAMLDAETPSGRRDSVREALALLRARVLSGQRLALRAAWRFDRGERASLDASMAKAYSASLAMEIGQHLASLFPDEALRCGSPVDKFHRDAKAFDILEGTGDMQRLMIARMSESVH